MSSTRPAASLSVDLDNKWAYLRAAGRDDWENCSSYLPTVIERMIDLLGPCELPLTVFLVGRDLRSNDDVKAIERFSTLRAWEPANHSYNHLPWMHTLGVDVIRHEIESTHHAIDALFARQPRGFRGPGFSCPDEVLDVLSERNYLYDASIFPTSIAPIARAVFLTRTRLRGEQRERAKRLYGGFAAMRNPNRPHLKQIQGRSLSEVPVTVMPLIRTPIHFSYLNFIAEFSVTLAKTYFRTALATCRRLGVPPSLLLHPPDFLGSEDDTDLAYLPGMKTPRSRKLEFMKWALSYYATRFNVTTMIEQVQSGNLPEKLMVPTDA